MNEAHRQSAIRTGLGQEPNLRLWRNNRGKAWQGEAIQTTASTVTLKNPRRLEFGLCNGASDLLGIRRVVVTPDMVGQVVGLFAAIEVKAEKGRKSEDQKRFVSFVNAWGGLAGFATGPDEARVIMKLHGGDDAAR